jgi:hypothetical protein
MPPEHPTIDFSSSFFFRPESVTSMPAHSSDSLTPDPSSPGTSLDHQLAHEATVGGGAVGVHLRERDVLLGRSLVVALEALDEIGHGDVALGRLVAEDLQRLLELDAAGTGPHLPGAGPQHDLPEELGLTLGLSLAV